MLNGYLFLSKKIESAQLIKKNEDFLYNSFEEILIKITNRKLMKTFIIEIILI